MDADLKKPEDVDGNRVIAPPLFIFWSVLGSKSELFKKIEIAHNAAYVEKFGDPIAEWKERMHAKEQARGSTTKRNNNNTPTSRGKGKGRRYAVSVQTFTEVAVSPDKDAQQQQRTFDGPSAEGNEQQQKLRRKSSKKHMKHRESVFGNTLTQQMRNNNRDYEIAKSTVKKRQYRNSFDGKEDVDI